MQLIRTQLVPVTGLVSSYKKKSNPSERLPIEALGNSAKSVPEMAKALQVLNQIITEQNGTLYITDLFRPWDVQDKLRTEYELSKADPNIKDKAYAAVPGGSFHQAGRAVDFSVSELNFKDVDKDKWLKKFWDIAKPLGFNPIIKIPDLGISECWHFDYPGSDFTKAYNYMDDFSSDAIDYTLVAKCGIIDAGCWNPKENAIKIRNMFIQSQLIRLGRFEIGSVDGILGKKSIKALTDLGINQPDLTKVVQSLIQL